MSKVILCALAVSVAATLANADSITFTNDSGSYLSNGFQSVDSSVVTFNAINGGQLYLYNSPSGETDGNGLVVLSDDTAGLEMIFSISQTSLSLDFGNDQSGFANPGDLALLTLYQGATQVAQFSTAMNLNDLLDQTVGGSFAGGFDRATLFYTDSSGNAISLTECVDNINFAPTPGAAAMLGLGGVATLRRRRR